MKGKDLILYILQNNLEDEEIFQNGRLLGFMTAEEAAVKFGVGTSTIIAWISTGQLQVVKIGDMIFIPELTQNPKERIQNEENITSVSAGSNDIHASVPSTRNRIA